MKVRELRIGNLLHEDVLGVCEVSQITEKTIWVKVNNYKEDGTVEKKEYHIWIDHLKPIPINEEWLLKFGFETEYCDDGTPYYAIDLNESKYCTLSIMWCEEYDFKEIILFPYNQWFRYKYIHQLQNLYFALTGKELIIKELAK